jgi:signal transduction histidine kinase
VPRDNGIEVGPRDGQAEVRPPATAIGAWISRVRPSKLGLSAKLLLLTIAFVMLAEVLIFVPSIANYRVNWLTDRLTAAHLASLAAEGAPGGVVPEALRKDLLNSAQVKAVAIKRANERRMVLPASGEVTIDAHYELSMMRSGSLTEEAGRRFGLIGEALAVFFRSEDRTLRITGEVASGDLVEVVLPEAPLHKAMVNHGLNILGLSVIISMITAAFVYFALNRVLVQPMMRISANMMQFSQKPEDASRIITPSQRKDEIGDAERELAHMQQELSHALLQKNRLAQLGLAVSKINHDLRNMLANAQLISDRLTAIPDPTVQRFAPKLIASLDRAIGFCNDTLRFGRAEEAAPRRELFVLRTLVEEVGEGLGLPRDGICNWQVDIPEALRIDADRDHMFRIVSNLARNAVQALDAQHRDSGVCGTIRVAATREAGGVTIEVSDDGPGVPARARERLFQAFQGSARKGGTGLGLAIVAELVAAHGGTIRLAEAEKGAIFQIEVPDRAVA